MTKKTALFTGTFNPFHVAHTWQLERAHAIVPFDEVIVAVIRDNPKKQDAIAWVHRVALAKLTLAALTLPFEWKVTSIENVSPDVLQAFKEEHLPDAARPLRIIGSDSLIEFTQDSNLRGVLSLFEYVVTLRPETNPQDVDTAIADIRNGFDAAFDPTVVQIPAADKHLADVSARNLRGDIAGSSAVSLIVPGADEYMQANELYSYVKS